MGGWPHQRDFSGDPSELRAPEGYRWLPVVPQEKPVDPVVPEGYWLQKLEDGVVGEEIHTNRYGFVRRYRATSIDPPEILTEAPEDWTAPVDGSFEDERLPDLPEGYRYLPVVWQEQPLEDQGLDQDYRALPDQIVGEEIHTGFYEVRDLYQLVNGTEVVDTHPTNPEQETRDYYAEIPIESLPDGYRWLPVVIQDLPVLGEGERHVYQPDQVVGDEVHTGIATTEPIPIPIPQTVTPRQFRLALINAGIALSSIEASLADNELAMVEWEYASEIRRDHALIDQLAAGFGKTEEEVDDLFRLAATL